MQGGWLIFIKGWFSGGNGVLTEDSDGIFLLGECAQAVTGMRSTDVVEVETRILAFKHAAGRWPLATGLGFPEIVVEGVVGLD